MVFRTLEPRSPSESPSKERLGKHTNPKIRNELLISDVYRLMTKFTKVGESKLLKSFSF
jgi:hypothetical protein